MQDELLEGDALVDAVEGAVGFDRKKEEEAAIDFLSHYVKPHNKVSREVTDADIDRVVADAHIMYNLCFTQRGPYPGGYAVAHPQINDTDPLQFFVTKAKEMIINPVIIRHTNQTDPKKEGCLTYPDEEMIDVQRYYRMTVEYQTITDKGALTEKRTIEVKGLDAQIWQHETDHLAGKYIYDNYVFKK